MSFTFVSRRGGGADTGVIVLWYGIKADIPDGWEYYSAAADMLVMGATTVNTTPVGTTTHTHSYSADTGLAGYHKHVLSDAGVTIGAPTNMVRPSHFATTPNAEIAADTHTNHVKTVVPLYAVAHDHSLLTTGSAANLPLSIGLYFIRKI